MKTRRRMVMLASALCALALFPACEQPPAPQTPVHPSAPTVELAEPAAAPVEPPPAPVARVPAPPPLDPGNPIAAVEIAMADIQRDMDAMVGPLESADAVIDAVALLPKELKAAKSKASPGKLRVEVQKVIDGGEANLDGLGLDDPLKAHVTARLDRLEKLLASIKALPERAQALAAKIHDLTNKIAPAVAAAAKAQAKTKMPFGVSADDRKKAEEDVRTVEGFRTQIPARIQGWMKDLSDLPARAAAIPVKVKAALARP